MNTVVQHQSAIVYKSILRPDWGFKKILMTFFFFFYMPCTAFEYSTKPIPNFIPMSHLTSIVFYSKMILCTRDRTEKYLREGWSQAWKSGLTF